MPAAQRRRFDALLAVTLAGFAATSFLFDRAAAFDLVGPGSADPFGRALYWYAARYDPLVAANPLFLRVMSGISAFVFGPLYLYLAHGFATGKAAIRGPAVVWGYVMLYSMAIHLAVEIWGELPPPNMVVFAAVYIPYTLVPASVLWRFRRVARTAT